MKVQVVRLLHLVVLGSLACSGRGFVAVADASTREAGEEEGVDAGSSILGQSPADGPTCDATKAPAEDPCVVDDAFGVFVSPAGRAGAGGTKGDPLAGIADAVRLAVAASKRVYVCGGTYDEQLTLDASVDGVSIYGGFDCAGGWTYAGAGRDGGAGNDAGSPALATLAPRARGVVLTLSQLTRGVTIEDLGLQAAPGSVAGDSSIAVVVDRSTNVVLRRCSVSAGPAVDGASASVIAGEGESDAGPSDDGDGGPPDGGPDDDAAPDGGVADATAVAPAEPWEGGCPNGAAGTATGGGAATTNVCGTVTSTGGFGGAPAPDGGAWGGAGGSGFAEPLKRPFCVSTAGAGGDAGAKQPFAVEQDSLRAPGSVNRRFGAFEHLV